ncbi:glycoside hydrolase family 19 protein [Myxacorys almedinensis A]|uniref:Glycoside hydrolase family 19 protein n=1 Tax=Myxacorys almedinensis A TaxID=2690445 RepID=A0A8J8CJG5_9CYAN|nr:glycoside hydrolase family 19 protein [Myxacorys almedinensis A]
MPAITVEQLMKMAPYASSERIKRLYPHLILTMAEYDITTPLRETHFLSQLIHESGSFHYVEEIDAGDYLEGRTDIGNTEPGDGRRYKGRGLIQITGRTNYDACGQDLGVDLLNNPALLTNDDLACLSAGWFWQKNNLNQFADADDVEMVTRTINGGLNGFAERQSYLAIAKEVLYA